MSRENRKKRLKRCFFSCFGLLDPLWPYQRSRYSKQLRLTDQSGNALYSCISRLSG